MVEKIKVIKPGRSRGGCYVKRAVCTGKGHGGGGCGAQLEADEKHIYPDQSISKNTFHFNCPECHVTTGIKVPEQIARRIRNRYLPD